MGNIASAKIRPDEWTKIAHRRYTLSTHCRMFRLNGVLSGSWPKVAAELYILNVRYRENNPSKNDLELFNSLQILQSFLTLMMSGIAPYWTKYGLN
jgi:hypothetical protein